ncbi:hypothetical protein [Longimicrobium sp.]|uniref:hypothetical protein n=1 Tax=Longimicrobium sp. TaxID=2029185 RepID=UPI002E32F5E7|nr:hypothetical protein [Longimicrobium sp.]HEX6042456.1 hypothetical protein [Longimicrobium sp.]
MPMHLRARLGWPEDRVCGTADGVPVCPAQLKLRAMNFGQHWRTEGIEEVDCSFLLPLAVLTEEMQREHADFVADSVAHPSDDPFEQALRERGWPSVLAILADDALLGMAAAWYGMEILARWLGDAWPDGALPTEARPWFVLNTAGFRGREGDLLRFEGRARRAGVMDVRYQDV